jgi:hypothetical protein
MNRGRSTARADIIASPAEITATITARVFAMLLRVPRSRRAPSFRVRVAAAPRRVTRVDRRLGVRGKTFGRAAGTDVCAAGTDNDIFRLPFSRL